jgi:tRNA pseudouridine55 synthase
MDGIVNIHKAEGMTSFDVIAKMRRILSMKKIGHAGTLDPDATGVSPVCLGRPRRSSSI